MLKVLTSQDSNSDPLSRESVALSLSHCALLTMGILSNKYTYSIGMMTVIGTRKMGPLRGAITS